MKKKIEINFSNPFKSKKPKRNKSTEKASLSNIKKIQIRKLNPNIFHFNSQSVFIYQPVFSNIYFNTLENKNSMKPTQNEIVLLNDIICKNNNQKNEQQIFILPIFKSIMENVHKIKPILSQRDIIIRDIINSSTKDRNISIKKITNKFNEIAKEKGLSEIRKSTMHFIMRKKLKYHFCKKTIKNDKIVSNDFIKFSFFFIKVILRSIKLGLKFIFLDESGFFLYNNNFRNWVSKKEEIYFGNDKDQKINLLLAVSADKIFYYQINKINTTSNVFKNFMEQLIKNMTEEERENHVFILDNFAGHLTLEMFEFYRITI